MEMEILEKKREIVKIDPDSISNIDDISINLECPICLCISMKTVMCSECYSIFCSDCLTSKIKKCPLCNHTEYKILPTNKTPVSLMQSKLKHKCIYENRGCRVSSILPYIREHELDCTYKPVYCSLPECRKDVSFREIGSHALNDCLSLVLDCHICNNKFNFTSYSAHLKVCIEENALCGSCITYYKQEVKEVKEDKQDEVLINSLNYSSSSTPHENCLLKISYCESCLLPEINQDLLKKKHECLVFDEEFSKVKVKDISISVSLIDGQKVDSNNELESSVFEYSKINYKTNNRSELEKYLNCLRQKILDVLIINKKSNDSKIEKLKEKILKILNYYTLETQKIIVHYDSVILKISKSINLKTNEKINTLLENTSLKKLNLQDTENKIQQISLENLLTSIEDNKKLIENEFFLEKQNYETSISLLNDLLYTSIVEEKIGNRGKSDVNSMVISATKINNSENMSQGNLKVGTTPSILSSTEEETIEVKHTRTVNDSTLKLPDTYMNNHVDLRVMQSLPGGISISCTCKKTKNAKLCSCCELNFCNECKSSKENKKGVEELGSIIKKNCNCFSRDELSYLCSDCDYSCRLCGNGVCPKCFYKCFSLKCSNVYCPRCFSLNKHQIRKPESSCSFTKCKECSNLIKCILYSIHCSSCEIRVCSSCFLERHSQHNNLLSN